MTLEEKKNKYIDLLQELDFHYKNCEKEIQNNIPKFNGALCKIYKQRPPPRAAPAATANPPRPQQNNTKRSSVPSAAPANRQPPPTPPPNPQPPPPPPAPSQTPPPPDPAAEGQVEKEKFIRQLYYKISLHLHPDKTDDKIKISFFNYCQQSREENILYKLVLIAEKFQIKYDFRQKYYTILDMEIQMMQCRINNLKRHLVFLWANEKDQIKKKKILMDFIKSRPHIRL